MNHRNTTLVVAAIVAAAALTGVAFAIPQQVMAGGYYGHRHHNNNHNGNSIRVNQAVNQLNACNTTSPSPPDDHAKQLLTDGTSGGSGSSTVCLNFGSNSADIHGGMHR
ncbi:hypothetical protein DYY65_11780 [Nitrososphaera sp. AFS]|nr:hypothetical protein [Nitrososphaera sp. AFS]